MTIMLSPRCRWVHDYQEACMAKLETFLKVRHPKRNKSNVDFSPSLTNCEEESSDSSVSTNNVIDELVRREQNASSSAHKGLIRKTSHGILNTLRTIVENY